MSKNGKQVSKKCENGYRKKIHGSLYIVIEEINKNDKRNGD